MSIRVLAPLVVVTALACSGAAHAAVRGAYRARLVGSDALGARSAETRIALRIVRP